MEVQRNGNLGLQGVRMSTENAAFDDDDDRSKRQGMITS